MPTNINHCVTPHPVLAVARGAVMFGINPLTINSRLARYNIGIRVNESWNDLKHWKRKDLKYYCNKEKNYRCKNIFSPIILKNNKIKAENWISRNYKIIEPKCSIVFIKTDCDNAIFTDDEKKNVKNLGKSNLMQERNITKMIKN